MTEADALHCFLILELTFFPNFPDRTVCLVSSEPSMLSRRNTFCQVAAFRLRPCSACAEPESEPSSPRALEPSCPRALVPSCPRALEPSCPRALEPSSPRALVPSSPRALSVTWVFLHGWIFSDLRRRTQSLGCMRLGDANRKCREVYLSTCRRPSVTASLQKKKTKKEEKRFDRFLSPSVRFSAVKVK